MGITRVDESSRPSPSLTLPTTSLKKTSILPKKEDVLTQLIQRKQERTQTALTLNALDRSRNICMGVGAAIAIGSIIGAIAAPCPPLLILLLLSGLILYAAKKRHEEGNQAFQDLGRKEDKLKDAALEFEQNFPFFHFRETNLTLTNDQINVLEGIQALLRNLEKVKLSQPSYLENLKRDVLSNWKKSLLKLSEGTAFKECPFSSIEYQLTAILGLAMAEKNRSIPGLTSGQQQQLSDFRTRLQTARERTEVAPSRAQDKVIRVVLKAWAALASEPGEIATKLEAIGATLKVLENLQKAGRSS